MCRFWRKRRDDRRLQRFTYEELTIITMKFDRPIERGNFGYVYFGRLADHNEVAVKVMSGTSSLSEHQFRNQIQILSKVRHKNLFSLVGYCDDEGEVLAIVYEFMPRESLSDMLNLSDGSARVLSWAERLQIAIDVAQGLDYLHNVCPEPIIHRDVKTDNIFVDIHRETILAGFELAKLFDSDTGIDMSISSVAGTPGYIDPQYLSSLRMNRKTDVYSFGVVLLEIITGQLPILRTQGGKRVHIVKYIESCIGTRDSVDDIADTSLQGEYDTNSIWMVMDLGMRCTAETSIERPTIAEVLILLRESLALETARGRVIISKNNYRDSRLRSHQSNVNHLGHQLPFGSHRFTYAELKKITKKFERPLGKGGFGTVFYGNLENGTEVAVKKLSSHSKQGSKEFLAEVSSLSQVSHRNLVSLLGYCNDGTCLALVYEYMPQGSLEDHLRGRIGNAGVFSWVERLRTALDAARGLDYLHNVSPEPIIHRDVKSSNILLNKKLEAKVSDFGLSKSFDRNLHTHVTAEPAFTCGYLAPECFNVWKYSEKTDVYSFGVVLLEIVTGQPPILKLDEAVHIVQHVNQTLKRENIHEIADGRLEKDYDALSVQKVVDLAMACTGDRIQRPKMAEVALLLKDCLAFETTVRARSRYTDVGSCVETEYMTGPTSLSSCPA